VITKTYRLGWLTAPAENTLLQVPRALVVSGLAAILDFALLIVLVERASWHPVPAAILSYLVGGVLQYVLSSLWVFPNAPANAATGFVAFTVLSLVGLGITWMTLALLHDGYRVNYALAKMVALGLAFTWNFLSRKYWLFKRAC
jgi:putative flippase GtrA